MFLIMCVIFGHVPLLDGFIDIGLPEEYDNFLAWYLNKGPGKPELFNHVKSIKQTLFPVLREVTKENGIMVDGRNYYEDYL